MLRFTTNTPTTRSRRIGAIASVINAPRRSLAARDGQYIAADGSVEWCFICRRATDHTGEHTPKQWEDWMDDQTAAMLARSPL